MEKSRLIQTLRTFSKKEIRECRKWLQSPAHNQREDVQVLFEYLTSNGTLLKEDLLKKECVYTTIFPDEPFEDAKMRQVMFFLMKSVEDFLVYQEWVKDDTRAKITLATVYRKRQLFKYFNRSLQNARHSHEQQPYRNKAFYETEYALQYEEYTYLSGVRRTGQLNLQEVSDTLDLTFLIEKLRQAGLMYAHQTVVKTEYRFGMLTEVLEYIEQNDLLEEPAIAMYYYSYKALADRENEDHFVNLKRQLFDHSDLFPDYEIRDIFLLGINYCIGRMNSGVVRYRREAFELFKRGFEKRILLQNGLVSRYSFLNVVAIGLMLEEFDWIEAFIHEFESCLEEQYRESTLHYTLGRLHFARREYQQSMRQLTQVEFEDVHINLYAKTMLLKMYYELDEFNALDSLLESMRVYLRRKEGLGYHKKNYQNFINFTKKLINLTPYDQAQKETLRAKIQQANPLTEREWLLNQLEHL